MPSCNCQLVTCTCFVCLKSNAPGSCATAPAIACNPGLISRSLACDDTGTWTEVSRWSSQAQADAAGQAVMTDPDVAHLMAAIDMASLTMRFVPILWQNPD